VSATHYAALGYAVLPLMPHGKRPATAHGLHDATTDPDIICTWPATANLGLLPPAGVLVLDADTPAEVDRLETDYPELATAPRCDTPRGGAHLYTRLPDGTPPPRATVRVQGRDLDVRGLGRAYLVAPPSVTPQGAYRWTRDLVGPDDLPETPAALLTLLRPPPPTTPPRQVQAPPTGPVTDRTRRYALAALQAEHDNVAAASEGTRNDTLNRAAFALGRLVGAGALDRREVEDALRAAAEACGLGAAEAERTIDSGLGAGMQGPREMPAGACPAPTGGARDPDEITAGDYAVKGHVTYRRKTKMVKVKGEWQEEREDTPLCNFAARIAEERERDDGVERTLTLVLEGTLATGQPLPPAEVGAAQFAGMGWPVAAWGSRAVVYAGQGTKDHLRAAIQMLSGDVPRRRTYTHLGWRDVDGHTVYLHAGGAVGAPGVEVDAQVELEGTLARYALPTPPTGATLAAGVRASLAVLDTAPDSVTVPLLGAVYRAPLGDVDFGLHLAGQTGAGKSELAALAQQHYGPDLDARNLPGSWSSTANALEGLAFCAKDAVVVVDDFAPEGSAHDIARYHAAAARLLRAQGNRSGRGRMRADGTLRPDRPPRGLIVSTGEDIPRGHSIRARALILELAPGALDWRRVTACQTQAAAGVYAQALAGYLAWLAADYTGRTTAYRAAHRRYRAALQTGGHRRTVDAGAQLLAAWELLATFAVEVGALTAADRDALLQRVEAGMQAALAPQAAHQAQSDPVARFGELLTGLFVAGRAHVVDAATGDYPGDGWGWETHTHVGAYGPETTHRPGGDRIGWVDGDNLYLEPAATYRALSMFTRDQGESLPVTERTLWKRLAERGLLLSTEDNKHTVKRTLSGAGRVRVLHLAPPRGAEIGAIGALGAEPVPDAQTRAPIIARAPEKQGHPHPNRGASGTGQTGAPERAPETIGARAKIGARETTSQTGRAPAAPIAPKITGVEAPVNDEPWEGIDL
jgi:hypothetical protein